MFDNLTGSLTSNHLTTVSYVLDNLGATAAINNATVSASIYRFIGEVSSKYEGLTFSPLREQQFIGEYNGNGDCELTLNNTPIRSITSIKYRTDLDSTWQLVTNNFTIDKTRTKIVIPDYTFVCGVNNYQITYNAGYSPIPVDLQELANDAVFIKVKESNIISGLSESRLGQRSRQSDGTASFSTTFVDLTDREERVLKGYKRIFNY